MDQPGGISREQKLELVVRAALAMRRMMLDGDTLMLQVPREPVERFDALLEELKS